MEQLKLDQLRAIADALTQPAFAAKDGTVCYANSTYAAMQIAVGTPLNSFFYAAQLLPISGSTEFSCTVAGVSCTATAISLQDCILYILRPQEQKVAANALSHAVKSIRTSLHSMYNNTAALCDFVETAENETYQAMSAGLLQQIYRLEQTAQNLELLQTLSGGSYALKPEKTDILSFLSPLLSHAESLLHEAEIQLTTELPTKLFNGYLDCKLAQAVIWNALSNAAKNTTDGKLLVRAEHRGSLLQMSFIAHGEMPMQAKLFERYQVPLEDALYDTGNGFGLSVIREAVALHGGTMLFSAKPGKEISFTVTFDLTKAAPPEVHNTMPVLAGLDLGLVHLSTVLPCKAYDSRDIL